MHCCGVLLCEVYYVIVLGLGIIVVFFVTSLQTHYSLGIIVHQPRVDCLWKYRKGEKNNSSLCLQVYPKTSRYEVSCHNHPVDIKQKHQIISHLCRALVLEMLTLSSSVAEAWFKHGI